MPPNELKRASLHDWEAESLRLTSFVSGDESIKSEDWWQAVSGVAPETEVSKPKLGDRVQQGPFGNAQLTLRIRPSRIDWMLGAMVNPEQIRPEGILNIGRFDETCPKFKELAERWFAISPPLTRIAFGAVLMLPVSDRPAGYRQLQQYLPAVRIDPEGSTDLLYRINRKRVSRSGVDSLQINRLSAWSVASVEYRQFEISAERSAISSPTQPVFACRIEIDINTGADFSGKFSPKESSKVFQELIDLGYEIIEMGDIQ